MGFLSNIDLANINTDEDWTIPNGTYPVTVTGSKEYQSEDSTSWQITYTIDPDVEEFGKRTVSEFFDLDPNSEEKRKKWLKRRLESLGITESEFEELEFGDIIGIEGFVTVKNRTVKDKTYCNVTKFVMGDNKEASDNFFNQF